MTEIMGYCPGEGNAGRIFTRVDKGIALIGRYRCNVCNEVYTEPDLQGGEDKKDLADLIREKVLGLKNGRE